MARRARRKGEPSTPEHLEPLFVIAGAAGQDRARRVFHDAFWGKAVSGYAFG